MAIGARREQGALAKLCDFHRVIFIITTALPLATVLPAMCGARMSAMEPLVPAWRASGKKHHHGWRMDSCKLAVKTSTMVACASGMSTSQQMRSMPTHPQKSPAQCTAFSGKRGRRLHEKHSIL